MAYSAAAETERFLELHVAALETSSPEALTHASSQIDDLVKFIRRLRSERKISDFELGQALAIAKRIPPHSSHSPSPAELKIELANTGSGESP